MVYKNNTNKKPITSFYVNEFQNKDIIGGSEKSLSWNNGLFDLLILTILQVGGR